MSLEVGRFDTNYKENFSSKNIEKIDVPSGIPEYFYILFLTTRF